MIMIMVMIMLIIPSSQMKSLMHRETKVTQLDSSVFLLVTPRCYPYSFPLLLLHYCLFVSALHHTPVV